MPGLVSLRALALAVALSVSAAPALSQSAGYDANCDPRNYTSDEQVQQELCMAHIGCRMTAKAATSACKVKDFFSNLGNTLTGRSTPDNTDVAYALSQTEIVQTPGVTSTVSKVRSSVAQSRLPSYDRTNAAQVDWQQAFYGPPAGSAPQGYLNKGEGGFISWFEGNGGPGADGKLDGTGTQINSKGAVRSGTMTDGQLSGDGLTRSADGGWTGGRFTQGTLDGEGFQTDRDESGQKIVREGKFRNGKPDGVILTSWENQTARKELWKDGKMLAAGENAPRGVVPKDPVYKSPDQIAAEKAAAEEAAVAAQLASEKNPGALYTLGDEWAEKGDMPKAKAAWRELIKRFPDSPLATQAAGRLSGNTQAPPPTTQSSTTVSKSSRLGPRARAIFDAARGDGSFDQDYETMLLQCEPLINGYPQMDENMFTLIWTRDLQLALSDLEHARQGEFAWIDSRLGSFRGWFRATARQDDEINICFLETALQIVSQ